MWIFLSFFVYTFFTIVSAGYSVLHAEDGDAFLPVVTKKCENPLSGDRSFTPQEKWAWNERICLGKSANMAIYESKQYRNLHQNGAENEDEDYVGNCTPEDWRSWPESRKLRPYFIEYILNKKTDQYNYRNTVISFSCAIIDDSIVNDPGYEHFIEIERNSSLHTLSIDNSVLTKSLILDLHAKRIRFFNSKILNGTLFIRNGIIKDELNLSYSHIKSFSAPNLDVGNILTLRNAKIKNINLRRSKIGRLLNASGIVVEGRFDADAIKVGGSIFLRGGAKFADVNLLNAEIDGNLETTGSTFSGDFDGNNLMVGKLLLMKNSNFKGQVFLRGATITRNLETDGSTFSKKIDADAIKVGGSIFLRGAAKFADVKLLNAKIDGNLEATNSTFSKKFNADAIKVGGSIFLRGGSKFEEINLAYANIDGSLQFRGSQFNKKIDLTEARIGKELVISRDPRFSPVWKNDTKIILRNSYAGTIHDTANAWYINGQNKFVFTDLTGFTYDHFGGIDSTGKKSFGQRSMGWLLGWVRASEKDTKNSGNDRLHYNPQPYQQLANVLKKNGYGIKAKEILYYSEKHHFYSTDMFSSVENFMLKIKQVFLLLFIGFGYYTYWAVAWFLGIVIIGAGISMIAKDDIKDIGNQPMESFFYSLDVMIPFIELKYEQPPVTKNTIWVGRVLHIFRLVGFILATFFAAGLAGLVG